MDIKTILQDERKKKVLIIISVALLLIVGLIFFLSRMGEAPEDSNDQLLSDIALLAPKDNASQNADKLTRLPIISLSADNIEVSPGQPTVISWTSPNSDSCVDGDGNEILTTGSISITPTEAHPMDVICTNQKGTSIESIMVGVTTAPIIALSAYPSSVKVGDQSFISWNTINTTRCVDSAGKTLRLSDSFSVVVKTPYTFKMSCVGPKGESKNSVTVTIAPPQTKIVATKTTITTTPVTSTTVLASATKTTRSVTTSGGTTTSGKSSLTIRASVANVKYGESSVISWGAENATNCTGTTPTGVEILNRTSGGNSLFLMPGDPSAPLPNSGSITIRVLDGKTRATLKIQCTGADGKLIERSITVTSSPKTVDACKNFGRPIINHSTPVPVESGSPSVARWSSKCATKCTIDVVPWGELIYYTDTSTITDYVEGQDYNTYTSTRSLMNLGVNTVGGVRVYPGTPDPDPVILTQENPESGEGIGNFGFRRQRASQGTSATLKCTNESGSTPYSTTVSMNFPIIVHPSCGGWVACVVSDITSFVSDVGGAISDVSPTTWVDPSGITK